MDEGLAVVTAPARRRRRDENDDGTLRPPWPGRGGRHGIGLRQKFRRARDMALAAEGSIGLRLALSELLLFQQATSRWPAPAGALAGVTLISGFRLFRAGRHNTARVAATRRGPARASRR